ncbi:MAG TPA: FAD:protein FMN transferase [Flavihumibacter sp.]|nr:FAD:protein FMN transferase [Flavihumibacter sp.]
MGGRFEITVVDKDSISAENNIDSIIAEISRIENLISDWIPSTQVSQINQNAGIKPVRVDRELFALTQRALQFSHRTNGAFDISFAAMDRIWKFDGSMTEMPSPEAIRQSVQKVGYQNIILDSTACTIFLRLPGMKIGFGALGEGYAADRCREMMLARGVQAGIVNATGDMSTWGHRPDGKDWNIGVINPFEQSALIAVVPLHQGSVTTSGNYEKFVLLNGKRYSHIINPATGYPATGLTSVTVFGPSTEMANGFSTSLMVLGRKAGLAFIRQYPAYSCIMITDKGKVITSKNLSLKKLAKKIKH